MRLFLLFIIIIIIFRCCFYNFRKGRVSWRSGGLPRGNSLTGRQSAPLEAGL